MRSGLYKAGTLSALLLLLSVFNNCGGLDSPGSTSQSSQSPSPAPGPGPSPSPVPVLNQDFTDKIGVATGSLQTATATISGLQGATVSVTGADAQVSLDATAWSNAIVVNTAASTLHIRMSADPNADVIRTAQVNAGGLFVDWAVSTHPASRVFNTPGASTYTKLPIGKSLKVECWGGGGGGASGNGLATLGGGGGGGGYSMRVLDRGVVAANETVTVGAGGNGGGAGGVAGVNGSASSFGAHLTAAGGGGGKTAAATGALQGTPGTGGTGITADGANGAGVVGGKGGGAEGGTGGGGDGRALGGLAPGGGGGGTPGAGGGIFGGNGGAAAGAGGAGRCVVTVQP